MDNLATIKEAIDSEIIRLQQARELLFPLDRPNKTPIAGIPVGHTGLRSQRQFRGRPRGSKNRANENIVPLVTVTNPDLKPQSVKTKKKGKSKRKSRLSPEGRERIAAALRKRWAEKRKAKATA